VASPTKMLPSRPQAAPSGLTTSPKGTTAPPSTEILFSLPDQNPTHCPSGKKREVRPLRPREFHCFGLIQPTDEQIRGRTGGVCQPYSVGGDGNTVSYRVESLQRNIRAQIYVQPYQRMFHRLLAVVDKCQRGEQNRQHPRCNPACNSEPGP
jgi:hypothetical protein